MLNHVILSDIKTIYYLTEAIETYSRQDCLTVRPYTVQQYGDFPQLWTCNEISLHSPTGLDECYVYTHVCVFVCLSVSRITQKVMDGFERNSMGR